MKMNFTIVLPIKAKQIDEHYELEKAGMFDVESIDMGQSSTKIKLIDMDKSFNSIHFKFYLYDKEIDIYESGLFNRYRWKHLKAIAFVE